MPAVVDQPVDCGMPFAGPGEKACNLLVSRDVQSVYVQRVRVDRLLDFRKLLAISVAGDYVGILLNALYGNFKPDA